MIHTDLQIHKTGVELLNLAADVQKVIPRSFRGYGQRVAAECVDLLVAIARANSAKGHARAAHIEATLERLDVVQILLRIAHDKQLISRGLWSRSIELTGSIGRQAGGWLKSAQRSTAPAA